MEILDALSIKESRDYLLLISSIILLCVIYVLIRNYRTTKYMEQQFKDFAKLTNNTFAKYLSSVENHTLTPHDINQGNFGTLSHILNYYAVCTTDATGIITYVNEKFCKACGYAKEELIGKKHNFLASDIHDESFWGKMWNSLHEKQVWHGEISNIAKNGKTFWQDTLILPISIFSNNSGEGYISLRTDITNIKNENLSLQMKAATMDEKLHKAEDMLLHSEKMCSLGTIAAGIAHEINNPISFIGSNLNKIQEYFDVLSEVVTDHGVHTQNRNDDVEYILTDYKDLISETQDGVRRVKNIASDLKSFSHKSNDEFAPTNINNCIETALNLAKNELKYKIEVRKSFAENLPETLCVESQISQVLLNLFINASHAIDTKGILAITTKADANNIYISIKDNGKGMDKETQKCIFEPFFTTKPVGKGTGLGLSISHDIIKRHNGLISVRSEEGNGTEFVIQIPIIADIEQMKKCG